MKKITYAIAQLLAVKAEEKIKLHFKTNAKTTVKKLKESSEYGHLKRLFVARQKALNDFNNLQERLQKKFDVDIISYSSQLSVREKRQSIPNQRTLKNQLIVANQIDGIAPEKVVDHIVKKYTNV